jgi:predicted alpha-1,2-mannosidase
MKVGLSFVSVQNAEANLQKENPGWDFEKVRQEAKQLWSRRLNRVQVEGGTPQQRTIFYKGLYHMMLTPTLFSDANGDYIGFDSKVRRLTNSTQYANFSDWDIYRSAIHLQAWLFPRETSDMMQSLVRDAEQMGWLPKWPVANDVSEVMGGDSPPILLANAWAFGAQSFDAKSGLAFSIKSATQTGEGPHGYRERRFGEEYRKLGYIASESAIGSASQTLEYANSDFAISQFANALGDTENAPRFLQSSQNWKKLLDPAMGWIHTRTRDGKFTEGFDLGKILPKQDLPWDKVSQLGFEEGNTFQYTFMVPFDYSGLFQAMGGREEAVKRLDSFFTELRAWGEPYFNVENEPDFVVPYAYDFAGVPWKTLKVMTRIMAKTFSAAPSGIPGNDDLGATSGVYVWGALGLYPAIPGVPGLAVGTPMFERAILHFENGSTLEIGRSGKGIFVQALALNGHPWNRSWIPLSELNTKTAKLHFQMQETPDAGWAAGPENAPPSFGTQPTDH